ncbi:autotransporter assembly complex protein TamA [Litorimonas haliclonae]|uniref:autotransporter assembly complex protein TamA n=1 Tax=Litorimonas haliclonae TaxID=2081977 RepID=UPI0039EF97B3
MSRSAVALWLGLSWTFVSANMAWADEPLARVQGDIPKELREQLILAIGQVDEAPRSTAQARRRAGKVVEKAEAILRSQGYYESVIDVQIGTLSEDGFVDNDFEEESREALTPVLLIEPGPRFLFDTFAIDFEDSLPESGDALKTMVSENEGTPAVSAQVVASELRVVNKLKGQGYPDAKALPRKAVVDHATDTMAVDYIISTGRKTRFGEIKQTGTAYVNESWPNMISPFEPGEIYEQSKINKLSSRALGSGVFESATASLEDGGTENPDGTITRNVLLNIDQGDKNTISGEVGYSTSDGSGISASYERRNFIGYAQTLTLTAIAKTNLQSFGVDYNIPYAWRVDRELDLAAEVARENSEFFRGERVSADALLTQKISSRFKVSAGIGIEASQFKLEEDDATKTRSYLVQAKGGAVYDSRDNIFDPSQGFFVEVNALPTYNFGDDKGAYVIGELGGSTYKKVSDKFIAAVRAKYGSIFGADIGAVPLNQRFYGGGGGSVRGYSYQSISPRDAQGETIGGRSILEGSAELRYRGHDSLFDGNLGFVGFVDAATVGNEEFPDFDTTQYGAGFGVRYFTSFAPIRADIAFPINKRPGDDAFQIYISIGQAF